MNKKEIMNWLQDNLPEWPETLGQCMNIPDQDWDWYEVGVYGFYVTDLYTGESISKENFFDERWSRRLKPCGMSFKELMEDCEFNHRS